MHGMIGQLIAARPLASLVLALLLVLGSMPPLANAAPPSPGTHLTVLSSDDRAITAELVVNQFSLEQMQHGESVYHRVHIPDTEQTEAPGLPQVPITGIMLGIPTAAGLNVQVIAADYEVLEGYQLAPAPQRFVQSDDDAALAIGQGQLAEHFALDVEGYAKETFYPGHLVEVAESGYLRDQAVAQLQFYPVQHNPLQRSTRVYHRIVAQLTWDSNGDGAVTSTQPPSPAYEAMLGRMLQNYASLGRSIPTQWQPQKGGTGQGPATSPPAALKIGVHEDGVYKLTYTELEQAGFDPATADPRTIRMTNQGAEIAIYVHGQGDGVFDPDDYVLFLGSAVEDAYTTQNIYWLSAGDGYGLRMGVRDGTPLPGSPSPAHYPVRLHAEEDTAYWQNMPGQNGEDRWFWGSRLSPNTGGLSASRDYNLELQKISDTAASALIRVRLKGYTGLGHRTQIYLNGQIVDDREWRGQVIYDHQVTVPHSLLRGGNNVVTVRTVDVGAPVDQILVNWIELDYWGRYEASNAHLWFGTQDPGLQQFTVRGFSNTRIQLFDVTDPSLPVQITGARVEADGSRFLVRFSAEAQAESRYLALLEDWHRSPATVQLDQPSFWRAPSNGADYIIITHGAFHSVAQILASHRQAAGLRVAVVDIQDVYDEFSHGMFTPQAIRDFLRYAYENWVPPGPTYVLLVGDANQDYKDNLNTGTPNYVPSYNFESQLFGEVSSDNWFVAVSGTDPLPDMFIGRLVAQSNQEARRMVENIISYDQSPPTSAWDTQVLLVADDDETLFQTISEQLAARLPHYYSIQRVYAANYPPGNPRLDIISRINSGSILVNYTGHGEYYGWGKWNDNREFMLRDTDVASLSNSGKLPFITVGNCLNGFFAGPRQNAALAEVFQRRQNAGAIAMWAPTSLGGPSGHKVLLRELYEAIFQDDQVALGAATTAAKLATSAQNSYWHELVKTYILFGDPATNLGIPRNYPYVEETSPVHGQEDVLLDQNVRLLFSKPMDPATVVIEGAPGVAFTPTWSADATAVTLAHTNLVAGQTYQLHVRGQDRSGYDLGPGTVPIPWTFTTVADGIPPEGTITVPSADPTSVPTWMPLKITFSEPVRPESVTYTASPFVQGWLRWEDDGRTALFLHRPFQVGLAYTFTVTGARDLAGNPLQEPFWLTVTAGNSWDWHFPFVVRSQ